MKGHSSDKQFEPYYSQVINLDTQSAFLRQPLQPKVVEIRTGMAAQRDLRAPRAICHSLEQLCRRKKRKGPKGIPIEQQKKTFQKEYFDYFKKQPRLDLAAQLGASEPGSDREEARGTDREDPPRLLQATLRYHAARKQVVDVLFESCSSDLYLVVECLVQLCQDDEDTYGDLEYGYPDVLDPVEGGYCPYCYGLLPSQKIYATMHLLHCYKLLWYQEAVDEHLPINFHRLCLWTDCPEYGQPFRSDTLAAHDHPHWDEVCFNVQTSLLDFTGSSL